MAIWDERRGEVKWSEEKRGEENEDAELIQGSRVVERSIRKEGE